MLRFGLIAAFTGTVAVSLNAQQRPGGDAAARPAESGIVEAVIDALSWRSIGPANMGGRVTDVEGIPSPSRTFYVAAASGGIWKTTNGGVTFRPLFDHERVVSLGDLAIAPSDTLQVWAGTGEEDSRNSISPGGGVYKSTDGGLSWTLMGLEKTEHIGRIVVHPTNPDIVWVAAVGAAWRPSAERGLYKTTDGGRTWRRVKFVSERAGFVDLVIHPRDPNVLFATSWEHQRTPVVVRSGGPGSALWKSTDGGETWAEVTGGGFPATLKGRIGMDIARSNPDVIYALVEAERPDGGVGACTSATAGGCGLYRSADGGRTWQWRRPENDRPHYFSQVRVDPADPDRVYWLGVSFRVSTDGGRTARRGAVGLHDDFHALWIDPNTPSRMVVGSDGGIGLTFDRGGSYWVPNTFPVGQFYAASFDLAVPYNICGGLQDNGTWCGPSRRARGPLSDQAWFKVTGGDGFVSAQDPRDPALVHTGGQDGARHRAGLRTGEVTELAMPGWRGIPEEADAFRYNWNTPFLLSPYNPDVVYIGANRVLKSTARGDDLRPISPDLAKPDTAKTRLTKYGAPELGLLTAPERESDTYGTITALAESPVRRGLLLAGLDDGNVWLSSDDGRTWADLTPRFRGLVPETTYVSHLEASPHDARRFYVTFDDHRRGDFRPYVFVTHDGGKSFRPIASNLPTGGPDFVHVLREDPVNPDLLFLGTDVGLYVSLDQGGSWRRVEGGGFPTVPVHDLKIHPRDRELIVATHGRSLWIADIAPLQQLTPAVLASQSPVLFQPAPGLQFGSPFLGGGDGEGSGQAVFVGDNRHYGADIVYFNPATSATPACIVITDWKGDTAQTLPGAARAGLQRVTWNLRYAPRWRPRALSRSERRDSMITVQRADLVADSLIRAGMDEAVVRRVAAQLKAPPHLRNPAMVPKPCEGAGGAPRPADQAWAERPAEGRLIDAPQVVSPRVARASRDTASEVRQGFRAAGVPGIPPLLRPFSPGPAESGSYTVSLTVGGRTYTTRLDVITPGSGGLPLTAARRPERAARGMAKHSNNQ